MGNVLVRYAPEEMLADSGLSPEEISRFVREIFQSPVWAACDRGDGTKAALLEPVVRNLPPRLAAVAREMLYDDDFELTRLPPVAGMEAVTAPLLRRGLRLYVLSNAGFTMRRLTDAMPLLAPFSGIYISAEHRLLKPDPAIYADFCAGFGLAPQTCLFIDDAQRNVRAAEAAGMQALRFSSLEEPPAALQERIFTRLDGGTTE